MAETPLWQRYNVTEPSACARLLEAVDDGADLFVMASGAQVVGCVWCVARGAFDRSGYIRAIMVDARWRGRGFGRELLDYAEAFLAQQVGDVFLLVSDFNHEAQRFYRRCGYAQVGALPGYVVPDVTELIFHKRLQPSTDCMR
jgi:ribosomal protein S18 acetylase RimI-like enzyme